MLFRQLMDPTEKGTFVWLEVVMTGRVEWRYTWQGLGALLVMMTGERMMLR